MINRLLYALSGRLRLRLIDIDGKPYLERYYIGRLFGVTAYLHRFVSGDDERNVHDHPWDWAAALVLAGGYTEERVESLCPDYGWLSRMRVMRPGRVNVIRARDFHRVCAPRPGTWTLFIHGRRTKGWGFLERLRGVRAVAYHQPLDVAATSGWHLTAPRGRDTARAPLEVRHATSRPVRRRSPTGNDARAAATATAGTSTLAATPANRGGTRRRTAPYGGDPRAARSGGPRT